MPYELPLNEFLSMQHFAAVFQQAVNYYLALIMEEELAQALQDAKRLKQRCVQSGRSDSLSSTDMAAILRAPTLELGESIWLRFIFKMHE